MTPAPDFDSLVRAHSTEIFAYLWRLLRDTADAEDCLQETFLRAYRAYARLDGRTHRRAWLYKIASNTARTHFQRRQRTAARTADLDPNLLSDSVSLPDRVHARDRLAAVLRAVEALPPHQRAALILRQYQGLSYAAIAAALDCTEAAARANVYQALKKLRARFAEFADDQS